jgi:hypothetical protein
MYCLRLTKKAPAYRLTACLYPHGRLHPVAKHLLVKKQPIAQSVKKTMEEVGYEFKYRSRLLFWPIKTGTLIIQPVRSKTTRRNITLKPEWQKVC